MLLTILVFIVMLSVLVLIHELGHFLVAKKFGIKVEEFGFGFPPRVYGKKIGETNDLKREFTDLQAKLLAREMLLDEDFRKHINLSPAQEIFLQALMVGIGIEEVAEKSKRPVEEIEKLLRIGDLYLDFLPKEPETDS